MAVISAQSFHLASFPSVRTMLLHHISLSVIVSESHRVHPVDRPNMKLLHLQLGRTVLLLVVL